MYTYELNGDKFIITNPDGISKNVSNSTSMANYTNELLLDCDSTFQTQLLLSLWFNTWDSYDHS